MENVARSDQPGRLRDLPSRSGRHPGLGGGLPQAPAPATAPQPRDDLAAGQRRGGGANDPIVQRVGFFPWDAKQGKVTFAKMDVSDPNGDLGPQVLAFNAAAGRAYAMAPPRRMRDLKANFPNGVYQLEVDTSAAPINPRDWHFVVADHRCNTTDILSFPHDPKSPRVVP